jgi:hypothetical protein
MRSLSAAAFLVVLGCTVAFCSEANQPRKARFTTKPTVSKVGGSARITFSVSARTDVEVAVLDAKGKVVRHLAAGVIGGAGKAAAPLESGLSQSLTWDGKDDAGKPASGGPFKVRVGLDMQARLGRIIGGDPYAIQQVCGIATDKDGHLYVLHKGYRKGDGPMYLQVYDRTGKYLKTILPAPPSLPYEKVAAFGAAKMPDGSWLFQNHWGRWPHLYPVGSGKSSTLMLAPRATDDGRLMLHTAGKVFYINTDGSAPSGGFKGIPMWKKGVRNRCGPLNVCPSPDGKWVYISGPCAGWIVGCRNSKPLPEFPDGRVYRFEAKTGKAEKFIDLKLPADIRTNHKKYVKWPSYLGGWSSAGGIAVDAKGNVLVCDRANSKVAVYSQDGKPLGGLDIKDPWKVMVHPKTGELYVTVKELPKRNRNAHKTEVVKYSGWKKGSRVLARLDLGRKAGVPFFAIDTSGKQSVLWIAGGGKLLRVVDSGGALTVKEDLMERGKGALPGADRMGIDKQRNEIYVNDAWAGLYKYNGLTGKGGKFKVGGIDIDVGPDGNLYILGAVGGASAWMGFKRVTREGKPAPFPAWNGKHENKNAQYGRYGAGYSTKGLCVAADGKTYMLDMYAWNKYWVTVYDKNGKFLDGPRARGVNKLRPGGALIDKISNACGGIKVDRAGNIYFGMIGTPKGFKWPDGLKTRVNVALMGSIIKFGPKGGTVWSKGKKSGPKPAGPGIQLYRGGRPGHFMVGAVKVFGGAAPCTVFGSCACRSPRFELDEYGRLYVADVVTFRIRVYDAEGNLIRTIGSYGNPDTSGPESLVPKPEIGFGWPISACLAGRNLYVSDVVNRRVTRVDLSYAAEATAPIK